MILRSIDHLQLYVGNARAAAGFFCSSLGFRVVAESGPETGSDSQRSYLLEQGSVRLVLTSALSPEDPAAEYVRRHGDGVRDIALETPNAVEAFEEAVRRGAQPVREPVLLKGEGARVIHAAVAAPMGNLVHTFIQREGEPGVFMPGLFRETCSFAPPVISPFDTLDHLAICLEPGMLDKSVRFYEEVFDFRRIHEENVQSEYSGMNSKVVANDNYGITFPMMEPAVGARQRGQIGDFLAHHGGAGVQHLAMASNDIVNSVRALKSQRVEVLDIPAAYYEALPARLGDDVDLDLSVLREQGILADRDSCGILLQTFTRSVHPRRTLFFEVIQRLKARGFGSGNIRALFEAKEREEARKYRAAS